MMRRLALALLLCATGAEAASTLKMDLSDSTYFQKLDYILSEFVHGRADDVSTDLVQLLCEPGN